MPLVTIQSISPKNSEVISPMLKEVQRVGAKALGCSESNIWVIFQPVLAEHYIQTGGPAATPRPDIHPPIVTVKAQSGRTIEQRDALVKGIAGAIAKGLAIPANNIWIYYHEISPKDVWFNGLWAG